MNKKAFTMIEVIAIIALLGIILVITLPKFFSSRDQSKIQEKNRLIEMIVGAGNLYLINEQKTLGSQVTISELCADDYLKCPIKDPTTGTNMSGYVKSGTDANGILKYTYYD